MPLSREEAQNIGKGAAAAILSECKTQAGFMLELMDEIRENELGIAGTIVSPKKAKEEMLFRIDSEINTIKEVYPDIPVRAIILNELGEIRGKVANSDKKNPESAIRQAAEAYNSLHEKLFDTMLEDFAECQCGGSGAEGSNPGGGYVTVDDPGKTTLKPGEVISKDTFDKENERVRKLGEKPATGTADDK